MIVQVVFDLGLEGPFDYLVPENLGPLVRPGMRVKLSFGPKSQIGFVTGIISKSDIPHLKPVQSLPDSSPVFSDIDLAFARNFSAYYGCSLGEALGTLWRNRSGAQPGIRREHKPVVIVHRAAPLDYAARIREIMAQHSQGVFLVLVPDHFRAETLSKDLPQIKIGTRSSVFDADGGLSGVIMVDAEDNSYKQEQSPMYDTAQVLLTRAAMYGFDVTFVGISPPVELMAMAAEGRVKLNEDAGARLPQVKIVDLTNYKFVPGMVSPPVRDGLEAALKAGGKSILVLNRRGSYSLTRCTECGEILKCNRCDSPLIYSRALGQYHCRHCTYSVPGDTVCPKCHKPSWRSQGMGVEKLQGELKKLFPQARVLAFERDAKAQAPLGDFDILISTQAVLRFQGALKVQFAAFIDFDAELNRLDMRCAFHAFSLALHVAGMAAGPICIQTRNSGHYVLQSLSTGRMQDFYVEELRLRREFGFSPFKHWLKITVRAKSEKTAHDHADQIYNTLNQSLPKGYSLTPSLADAVGQKRGQFRFNVMLQTDEVIAAVAFVKAGLAKLKRRNTAFVAINVDP